VSAPHPLGVVTGASTGIGLELARVMARNGFDLVICSEEDAINAVAEELRGLDVEVEALQADLATDDGVDALWDRIRRKGRELDAVVLNAGRGANGAFVGGTELEHELDTIDLNVRGTVRLAKHVLPDMVRRGEGRVMFTSSTVAGMPGPYQAVYNASKSFVQSFALALREELSGTGVTVTALMPGATETPFSSACTWRTRGWARPTRTIPRRWPSRASRA
jgi:uncharacterized protein